VATMGLEVMLDLKDPRDYLDLKELLVLKDQQDLGEKMAPQALQEVLVYLVQKVPLETLAFVGITDCLVRVDFKEMLVLLDLLDLLVREDPLVLQEQLEVLEQQESLGHQESKVYEEIKDLSVALDQVALLVSWCKRRYWVSRTCWCCWSSWTTRS